MTDVLHPPAPGTTGGDRYDVIVIGAGPAGLQAGLTLGRMHRRTLVLDSGEYRNAPTAAMHNFLTRDGTPPAKLRAEGRRELEAYPDVTLREATAVSVRGTAGDFTLSTQDGAEYRAATLLLATGVRDTLPPIPGLEDLFGSAAAHCPFCHGHEYAGGTVAVLGSPHAAGLVLMMAPIAGEIVVIAEADQTDASLDAAIRQTGATLLDSTIVEVRRDGDRGVLALTGDRELVVDGFFVTTTFEQSAPFAAQLGLDLLPSGCIRVDGFGRTSVPGVYAAGDLAHTPEYPMPMAAVLSAAAAGLTAAASIVRDGVMSTLAA